MEMYYWDVAPETLFIHTFSKEGKENRDKKNQETWLLFKKKKKHI